MRQIAAVLGRQGRGRQAAALPIDALVIRQPSADDDAGLDGRPYNLRDLDHDAAVVDEKDIPGSHVPRQVFVGQADALGRALIRRALRVDDEALALAELDRALTQTLEANFRALQIGNEPHLTPRRPRRVAHGRRPLRVFGLGAVRIIQTCGVEAEVDEVLHHARGISRRTQGGNDLGPSHRRPVDTHPAARALSMATAGKVLSSRNSRKAPPPVEI